MSVIQSFDVPEIIKILVTRQLKSRKLEGVRVYVLSHGQHAQRRVPHSEGPRSCPATADSSRVPSIMASPRASRHQSQRSTPGRSISADFFSITSAP